MPESKLQRANAAPVAYALCCPKTTAFLASLFTAAIFMLPFILRRGGVLFVGEDQISQIIPFTQRIVENLRAGNLLYDFALDLGSGVVSGYTYYGLASVFNLPLLLFPAAAVPYLLGPLLMVKFGFSGLFAYLYLRLFTKTDLAALAGSLLYSFSGFAVANLIFPFEDIVALFPLLLWALEQALRRKKPGLFALAVALNIVVNPAFFAGAAIFLALYLVVRLAYRKVRLDLRLFGRLAAESLAGVLLSGAILLPFVFGLLGNPRLSQPLLFGPRWFFYVEAIYFEILRALVLPPEVMHANSLMLLVDAASPELYLPLFGLVPAFAWVLYKKRNWLKTLLLACFVMMLIPVLNAAFNGFNHTYYTRWLYLPLLAVALATVLWLEDAALPVRRGYVLWGIFAGLFAVCMVLWRVVYGYEQVVVYRPLFVVNLLVLAAGLVCTGLSRRVWACRPRWVPVAVAVFAMAIGGANLLFNQTRASEYTGPLQELKTSTFQAAANTPLPEGVYRISAPVPSVYFGHGSPFSFTTTVPAGVFELQAAFGRQRTSASSISADEPGLWALLGVEYILTQDPAAAPALPNLEVYYTGEPYSILRNTDALPLLVGFDRTIAEEDAAALDNRQRSIALLHGLVLPQGSALAGLEPIASAALPGLDYDAGVARGKAAGATDVQLGNGSVTAEIALETDGAVLVSLPFEAGWRCTVDGQPAQLHPADWGLMAFACPAGAHTVELHYTPQGGVAGLVMTGLGLMLLAVLIVTGHRKNNRAASGRGGKLDDREQDQNPAE